MIKKLIKTKKGTFENHKLTRIFVEESGSVGGIVSTFASSDAKYPVDTHNPQFDQEKLKPAIKAFQKACEDALILEDQE